jgi:RecB family exonuclease
MSQVAYDAGLAAFREAFAAEEAKAPDGPWRAGGRATKKFPNKEDKTWWLSEGPTMVHNYYTWRQQNPSLDIWHTPEGVPAIELGVVVTLPGDVVLKSYIDRIFVDKTTGKTMIVDLKTGKPPKGGLQLAVYRLALQQQFGESPDYGAFWMAREGTLDKVYELDQYPLPMVQRWMRDVKKAIDMQIFVPTISMLCDYCGVRKFCYAHGATEYVPDFDSDLEKQ